jgi:aminotransferase EvaB
MKPQIGPIRTELSDTMETPVRRIPMNDLSRELSVDRELIDAAVASVLDSGWLVLGKKVEGFERAFAEYVGAADCVGVANGTDALEIALRAVGVSAGDRVYTAANAGFYTSTACIRIGAVPVYVDVDPITHSMAVADLAEAIRDPPKAVVLTHLYGGMNDAVAIAALCREAGIPMIEDCAQAIGARSGNGLGAGSIGDLGCFSFYPTKNLGGIGDGGAITTSTTEIAARCRELRQYGWKERYVVGSQGVNSRLDEVQASVLLARLTQLDERNMERQRIATIYGAAVERNSFLDRLVFWPGPSHVAHLAVVVSAHRAELSESLQSLGIATDVHYPVPDNLQPVWQSRDQPQTASDLVVTRSLANKILSVPCFPSLTEDEINAISNALETFRPTTSPGT